MIMKGIDKFRERFVGREDEYVLIGGGAATCCSARQGRISGQRKISIWSFWWRR